LLFNLFGCHFVFPLAWARRREKKSSLGSRRVEQFIGHRARARRLCFQVVRFFWSCVVARARATPVSTVRRFVVNVSNSLYDMICIAEVNL
jgi:hypothetical protein